MEFFVDHKMIISTIPIAILKILLDELCCQTELSEWDNYTIEYRLGITLERLVKQRRVDAFSMIYPYTEKFQHLSPKLYDAGLLIRIVH